MNVLYISLVLRQQITRKTEFPPRRCYILAMYSNDIHTPHLFSTLHSLQKFPSSLNEYIISCYPSFPATHGDSGEGGKYPIPFDPFVPRPHSESSLGLILSGFGDAATDPACALSFSIFCEIKASEFSICCGLKCTKARQRKEGNPSTFDYCRNPPI